MKIDILVGANLYASTTSFAKSLNAALQQQGEETRVFWIEEGFFYQAFYEICSNPPDLTCSFSDIRLGNRPLADLWNIPHLSILVDPAIYFLHHLKSPFSLVSCVDEEDVSFIHSFGFKNAFFLPHAADAKEHTPPESLRPFEKVFFGSCIDIDQLTENWDKKYSKKRRMLLKEACEQVLSPKGISTLKALRDLGVEEKELPSLHYEVDLYTRGKDRIELLKKHHVHIWGKGPWEKFCPFAKVHPPVAFDECVQLMKQSKWMFNSSPRFKTGSHERIFYALMCGACPITLNNGFVQKHFSDEEMIFYELGEWEFSEKGDAWKERAKKGQQRVLSSHTWQNRAHDLVQKINDISLQSRECEII